MLKTLIHGYNFEIPDVDDDDLTIGFYMLVSTFTLSRRKAIKNAKRRVLKRWKDDGFQSFCNDKLPTLEVEFCGFVSFHDLLEHRSLPLTGFIFYPDRDLDEEPPRPQRPSMQP